MLSKTSATIILVSFCAICQSQVNDSTKGSLRIIPENGITSLQQQYLEQNKEDGTLMGFRVQVYNGNKTETFKKRSEFVSAFPDVPVYSVYEAPEYKIQAGDFRTRLEAEKFLSELHKKMGTGLILKTRINPPMLKREQRSAK